MARKQTRLSRAMLFTWLMLAGLILLFTPENVTNKLQFAFARIFRWPLSVGRNISLSARTQQPLADVVSRREYNKLQNHLSNVTQELVQKHKRVERLSGLHERLSVLEGARLMLADVITASLDGPTKELIINRGSDDGLAKEQFVLGDNSIIGMVSEVSLRTAKVRLITDRTCKVVVKIGGLQAVIEGDGEGSAKVQMLSIKHKVKVGEEVYARKKPGFLDAAMKVGTVTGCERDDGNPLLWDITVGPACDLGKVNDVAVIIMNPQG
jgi:rod shape-determining protein MreC